MQARQLETLGRVSHTVREHLWMKYPEWVKQAYCRQLERVSWPRTLVYPVFMFRNKPLFYATVRAGKIVELDECAQPSLSEYLKRVFELSPTPSSKKRRDPF